METEPVPVAVFAPTWHNTAMNDLKSDNVRPTSELIHNRVLRDIQLWTEHLEPRKE